MKLLNFFTLIMPSFVFINGLIFIVYLWYLSITMQVQMIANMFFTSMLSIIYILCISLYIYYLKRQRDENKFLSNL